ncbi:unnamed protein product [Symbiodinium natans]|uniref:Dynein heavy chain ATP-binding dynein motor region domain-containing protein n=1 Tax=Symbiodinium natans TaxID=878477 RepID=A0A812V9L7_9DINO|nr:unnamed protein product [Symbiodinium natans]
MSLLGTAVGSDATATNIYLISMLSSSEDLPASTLATCSVVNFTLTQNGLTQRLLDGIVRSEAPSLYQELQRLYQAKPWDETNVRKAEEQLLKILAENKGSILSGDAVVGGLATMEDAWKNFHAVASRHSSAFEAAKRSLRCLHRLVRPLALFLESAEALAKLNRFYRPSATQVAIAAAKALAQASQRSATLEEVADEDCMEEDQREAAMESLGTAAMWEVFRFLAKSLDTPHRLPFAFLCAVALARHCNGTLEDDQLELFWKGHRAVEPLAAKLNAQRQSAASAKETQAPPRLINPKQIKSSPDQKLIPGEKWELINFLPHVFPNFLGLAEDKLDPAYLKFHFCTLIYGYPSGHTRTVAEATGQLPPASRHARPRRSLVTQAYKGILKVGLRDFVLCSTFLRSCNTAIIACNSPARWTLAIGLLQEVEVIGLQLDVIGLNSAMSAASAAQAWRRPLSLLRDFGARRLTASAFTASTAASACAVASEWKVALEVPGSLAVCGVSLTAESLNAGQSGCSKVGAWGKALSFVECLRCQVLQPDKTSCNTATTACAAGSAWPAALRLTSTMWHWHVPPTARTTVAVLGGLGLSWAQAALFLEDQPDSTRDAITASAAAAKLPWPEALVVIATMPWSELRPDLVCWNSVLGACAECFEWPAALAILEEPAFAWDVASFGASMKASGKASRWQHALQLGEAGMSSGTDIAFFNTLLSAFERGSQWERALELFTSLGSRANQVSCTTVFSSMMNAGLWLTATRFVESLPKACLPDAAQRGLKLSALYQQSQWEAVLFHAQASRQRDEQPDQLACNVALASCEEGSLWRLALTILQSMPDVEVPPDVYSFSSALSACARTGMWEHAIALLGDMKDTLVTPNDVSYNSAISSCADVGKWRLALELLAELSGQLLQPDELSFSSAITSCGQASEWQTALGLLASMSQAAVKPNQLCLSAGIFAAATACEWEAAMALLQSIMVARMSTDSISWSTAISACEKSSRWQLASYLLEAMPEADLCPDEYSTVAEA